MRTTTVGRSSAAGPPISSYATVALLVVAGAALYAAAALSLGVQTASLAAITVMVFASAFARLRLAVAAMLLLWPLDVVGRVSADISWLTYSRLAIVGVVVAITISLWASREQLRWPQHLWVLPVFTALGALGVLQAGVTLHSVTYLVSILMPLAVVFAIVQVARSPEDVRLFLWAIVLSSVVPVVFGILDIATGDSFLGTAGVRFVTTESGPGETISAFGGLALWRITSTFTVVAAFARFCAFAFAATLGLALSASWRQRIVLAVIGAGQLVCIAFTFARAAYVTVAVVVLLTVILVPRLRRSLWALVPLALAAFVWFVPRLADLLSTTRLVSTSDSGRTQLWLDSFQVALARPVLGYGFGNAAEAIGEVAARPQDPHNIFLEGWLSAGLPAAVLLTGYLLWLFYSLLKANTGLVADIARPAALLMATVLISGLFTNNLFSDEIWIAIGIATVVIWLRGESKDESAAEPPAVSAAGTA